MDKRLEKRSANGRNDAGWASLWAHLGDGGGASYLGKHGGAESARQRAIRKQRPPTAHPPPPEWMQEEARFMEQLEAWRNGFLTVEDYKNN